MTAPRQVQPAIAKIAGNIAGLRDTVVGMNRTLSIALLVIGVALIAFGVSASTSFSSDLSRFFTGNPTDRSIWLLIGGIVAAVLGIGGMLRGGTPHKH